MTGRSACGWDLETLMTTFGQQTPPDTDPVPPLVAGDGNDTMSEHGSGFWMVAGASVTAVAALGKKAVEWWRSRDDTHNKIDQEFRDYLMKQLGKIEQEHNQLKEKDKEQQTTIDNLSASVNTLNGRLEQAQKIATEAKKDADLQRHYKHLAISGINGAMLTLEIYRLRGRHPDDQFVWVNTEIIHEQHDQFGQRRDDQQQRHDDRQQRHEDQQQRHDDASGVVPVIVIKPDC